MLEVIMIVFAIISISLALVFYSIGVLSVKIQGNLKKWHVLMFWIGLVFDVVGTTLMIKLANNGFTFNLHGIIGIIAIILMLYNAIWATRVLIKNDLSEIDRFHKFSILVWLIWLIPYVSGVAVGMGV
jgi:uncharacterized repeat protein (TIGR03987 family)